MRCEQRRSSNLAPWVPSATLPQRFLGSTRLIGTGVGMGARGIIGTWTVDRYFYEGSTPRMGGAALRGWGFEAMRQRLITEEGDRFVLGQRAGGIE